MHREVVSQFLAPRDERHVIDPSQRQNAEVFQGEGRPAGVDLPAARKTPPHRDDLQINDARCRQVLTAQPGAERVALRAVVEQRDGEDARVNDEHARTAAR